MNQQTNNYDTSKTFIWNNRYQNETITNPSYDTVSLPQGQLMGRNSSTGELQPLFSTALDGSEIPLGILVEDLTMAAGEQATVSICVAGDVAQEMIVLIAPDTLDTKILGRFLRDRIEGDTLGIKLIASDELTAFDNQ